MENDSLLKEILDSLSNVDTVNMFAHASGLTGDLEVENRLKELDWENCINSLWEELLPVQEPTRKKSRQILNEDQPSTSAQSGDGDETVNMEKPY